MQNRAEARKSQVTEVHALYSEAKRGDIENLSYACEDIIFDKYVTEREDVGAYAFRAKARDIDGYYRRDAAIDVSMYCRFVSEHIVLLHPMAAQDVFKTCLSETFAAAFERDIYHQTEYGIDRCEVKARVTI